MIIGKNSDDVKSTLQDLADRMGGTQMQLPSGEMTKVDPEYLIERSIHGQPSECISQMKKLIDCGVDDFVLYFWDFPGRKTFDLFTGKVMPAFAQ